MTLQRRRLQRIVLGAGLLALLGMLMLMVAALRGAATEDRIRHEVIAQRLFDELERELTALVIREESRSFLEYRYFYLPEGQILSASLVRSPISTLPEDAVLVGYFQIDPDGQLFTPSMPRENELELACNSTDYTPTPALDALQDELTRLTTGVNWEGGIRDAQPLSLPPAENPYQSSIQSLNRAQDSRQAKQQRNKVDQANYKGFTNNDIEIQEIVNQDDAIPVVLSPIVPPADLLTEQIDVVISPLSGVQVEDRLLLHRTIRFSGRTYRQGLVLDAQALLAQISQAVLEGSELEPYVVLSVAPSAADYGFTHRFAAPFTDLTVHASIAKIPGAVSGQRLAVLSLSAALLLTIVMGGVALRRMVAAELELAERRTSFVSAVTHELRTPLTAIRMYGEMLRDGMVPTVARKQQYYRTITSEAERLSRLIENVLTLSRLEKGKRTAHPVVGSVGPLLRQATEVLQPHAHRHGFTLDVTVADGLPQVLVDPDALSQVLVNLVDNAVKFSADSDHKHIEIDAAFGEEGVVLSIRDHGPGVPARQLSRIFQPFFRGERELTRKTKGTGIGLALVAGLIDEMGGRIAASNHPGGGLQVRVSLPVVAG